MRADPMGSQPRGTGQVGRGQDRIPLDRRHHDPAEAGGVDSPPGTPCRCLLPYTWRFVDQLGRGHEGTVPLTLIFCFLLHPWMFQWDIIRIRSLKPKQNQILYWQEGLLFCAKSFTNRNDSIFLYLFLYLFYYSINSQYLYIITVHFKDHFIPLFKKIKNKIMHDLGNKWKAICTWGVVEYFTL